MLVVNITTAGIELNSALRDHVQSRLQALEKILDMETEMHVEVVIGKTSNHHRAGEDVYKAELRCTHEGKQFVVLRTHADLYAAVDVAKDDLLRDIKRTRGRGRDLFIRGARSLKKRIKGFKPWPKA